MEDEVVAKGVEPGSGGAAVGKLEAGAEGFAQAADGGQEKVIEKAAALAEDGAQDLRNSEHKLPVGDGEADVVVHSAANHIGSIRQVTSGSFFFSASLLNNIVPGNGQRSGSRGEPSGMLSNRQLEVFEMVGKGFDSHEIGNKLELSAKTVDAHKANIRQKLGLDSARELLMEAVRWVEK